MARSTTLNQFTADNSGAFGYLVVIQNGQESDQRIVFPAINNDIELSRENSYEVSQGPVLPDGFHVYQNTSTLEIPIEFTLHYASPLCTKGPQTLLAYAASLQALLLPASGIAALTTAAGQYTDRTKAVTAINQTNTSLKTGTNSVAYLYPPACRLSLMSDNSQYKIQCHGFVKRVSVKFHAPYLQTSDSSAKNLPSSATYSFTFVNCPTYTNNPKDGMGLIQSFGPDVWNKLYDTAEIAKASIMSTKAINVSSNALNS